MKNKIINILNIVSSIISNTLFPVQCALCKVAGEYLCNTCENKLELNYILSKEKKKVYGPVNNLSKENWIYAKYKYQNYNLKKIEYKIKYNHHPNLAEAVGEYSHEFIYKNIILNNKLENKNICLIPIPISKERLKQRGYNQTEYIAKGINKMNPNLKILNMLIRKDTKKLKDIYGVDNRSEEMKNTMGVLGSANNSSSAAAIMNSKINLNNLDIEYRNNIYILIDDITTTGSTFYEARRTLVEYGIISKNIYAYALAH